MAAEVLIFIPSAAVFRQNWLAERAEAAGLITLAIEGVPDYVGGEMLSKQFMDDTGATMVAQKREGRSQLVLGMPPLHDTIYTADLQHPKRLPAFSETFRDFFTGNSGYLRILSKPTVKGVQTLEVLVPRSELQMALRDYCHRVLLWSFAISVLTGLMVYLALSMMIVRPIQSLASGLAAFRADPRKRAGHMPLSQRGDEIGQLQREFTDMKSGVRAALQQQERLATLGMAMAKINHDLRNVLTSAQLISDRLAADPDKRINTMGQRLVKAVERGVKLCEATLSFSKSAEERPEPRIFAISGIADDARQDAVHDHGDIQFKNALPASLNVYADPDQIYRLLHNLFRNAAQAMAGQSLETDSPQISVSHKINDERVEISIADTGPGLPKSVQDNLFKAFTSAASIGGTGLGLTIARELARANGGNLVLKSTAANGTVFALSLPSEKPKPRRLNPSLPPHLDQAPKE